MDAVLYVLFGLAVTATAAENLSAWVRGVRLFTWSELWADLRCAAAGFGVVALHRGLFLGVYSAVHAHAACFSLPRGAPGLALAFLAYDFVYYVDHRACHRVPWLWASHRVHHETRSFHLLTGLRMSMVGPLLAYGFRVPLAVLGVPPATYFAVDALHALLTYFTHARFVPDLELGWLLNTPAHHRLHHSVDPRHFGKNYGGVSLLWDRLFGTYAAPEPVLEFGDGETREPLGPLHAHGRMWRAWLEELAPGRSRAK
jgi:sterol desaturase/sphingolipid hydroxylase (fatty acid hydroxylase superfamily)